MAAKEKLRCTKCGKTMGITQFFTYKDGTHPDLCKKCMTLHVDNFDPSTFLWLLQKFDVPYVEREWNVLRDRAYATAGPLKMNGKSVIGRYLAKMRIKPWTDKTWADTQALNAAARAGGDQRSADEVSQYRQQLLQQLQSGEITQAEYRTSVPTEVQHQNENYILAANPWHGDPTGGASNPFQENNFVSNDLLPDVTADLTNEDKIYLVMKWGRNYSLEQLVALEQKYQQMTQSFDIHDSDTIGTLIVICKTYLKMNESIDIGDMQSFNSLSRTYDTLRKSAKFTAAQKKADEIGSVDSVGQLVAYAEKCGGAIPRLRLDYDYDVIDKVINDMKSYSRTLIYEDTALARQIEDYIKKREQLEQQKKDKADAEALGYDAVPLSDKDFQQHFQMLRRQKEEDDAL